jgi:hypothetical protein
MEKPRLCGNSSDGKAGKSLILVLMCAKAGGDHFIDTAECQED